MTSMEDDLARCREQHESVVRQLDEKYRQCAELITALQGALEAIAPCVVGWPEGEAPAWAVRLADAVPAMQGALGLPVSADLPTSGKSATGDRYEAGYEAGYRQSVIDNA